MNMFLSRLREMVKCKYKQKTNYYVLLSCYVQYEPLQSCGFPASQHPGNDELTAAYSMLLERTVGHDWILLDVHAQICTIFAG